jgi:two-component system OmpR family response regulator/two-component system response regulator QseB
MRILLVEDDDLLGDGLTRGLTRLGCAVDWVKTGESALTQLADNDYLALILDLGLPGRDGVEILRMARDRGHALPVLVLTARETTPDKLNAFGVGADDYVVKPIDIEELAARLRALVRRSTNAPSAPFTVGDVVIDVVARRVWRSSNEVVLSGKEFAVLEQLVAHAGKVLTRRQLEDSVYGWSDGAESNTLGVFIHHLRRKLGNDVIVTLRGIGYMLAKP